MAVYSPSSTRTKKRQMQLSWAKILLQAARRSFVAPSTPEQDMSLHSLLATDSWWAAFIVIFNHILTWVFKGLQTLHRYPFLFMAFGIKEMYSYAGILIVAALVIAFVFFSLTMLGWCTDSSSIIPSLPTTHIPVDEKFSSCMSLESHSMTFQYKAEGAVEGTHQTECIICLTAFEEEDSVRQLHSCKHIFHTPCIDMWLCSHSGCPLCRTKIDHVPSPNGTVDSEENSQTILVIVST